MQDNIDTLLSQAFAENPIQGAILGVLLDGGRIVSTGEISESLLNMIPDVVNFERRERNDIFFLKNLGAKDLLFVENQSIDDLWELAHLTAAQVALLSPRIFETELVDFVIQEPVLRSALLSLGPKWSQMKTHAESFCLEGGQTEKALFLDRDGVVIEDTNYVKQVSDVKIKKGVVEILKTARQRGYRLIVITNQSGIGRGLITWEQYDSVTLRMQELLAGEGVFLDRILKAPFFEKSTMASGLIRKSLRKPRPGMIHSVVNEFRIDLFQSILVGDSATDIMAGALAGILNLNLVRSEKFEAEFKKLEQWPLRNRLDSNKSWKAIDSLSQIF